MNFNVDINFNFGKRFDTFHPPKFNLRIRTIMLRIRTIMLRIRTIMLGIRTIMLRIQTIVANTNYNVANTNYNIANTNYNVANAIFNFGGNMTPYHRRICGFQSDLVEFQTKFTSMVSNWYVCYRTTKTYNS
jgi:hypothetical protein